MIKKITENRFDEVLEQEYALVDFSASWCGPCQMLEPVVDALAEEMSDQVAFFGVDVDENADLAMRYRVMSVPSILLFRNGSLVAQAVGYQDKDSLKRFIQEN